MRGFINLILVFAILCSVNSSADVVKYAGARQSKHFEYSDAEWVKIAKNMASYFPGSTPTLFWIVGCLGDGGTCALEFPGGPLDNATFEYDDWHDETLKYFDDNGVNVFLQVESGWCDLSELIDVVLNQYGDHKCVIGYGVDVEWYDNIDGEGTPVTDAVAKHWEQKVKAHKSTYKMYLKHWEVEFMPPTHRSDIIFVNDCQKMENKWRLQEYLYKWGREFRGNTIVYQGGYPDDYNWWGSMANPPEDIGNAVADVINSDQDMGMVWVDFTLDPNEYEEIAGLFDSDFTQSKLEVYTKAFKLGTITLSPAGGSYDYGTQVTATAKPNPQILFRAWAGDVSGSNASVTFTVTKNMHIDALFGYSATNITDLLDDAEDGNGQTLLEGDWFTGDDSPSDSNNSGASIITPKPGAAFTMTSGGAHGSKHAAKINYKIDNGTLIYHGHVKFGCWVDNAKADFSEATGLSFYHKGSTCKVQYETKEVVDTAYFFHFVEEHKDWTLVVVDLDDFKQPTDFGVPVSLKRENITAVSWEMMDRNDISEDVWIDDLRITGVEFDNTGIKQSGVPNQITAMNMKVTNRTLQVSYSFSDNNPVNISLFTPEGKLVKKIQNISSKNGKQSVAIDISALASGLYFVKLQGVKRGSNLIHRKFVYAR